MEDAMTQEHHNAAVTDPDLVVEPGAALAKLSGPARCDVVVIGGGQAGLSVGYHLKQRGLKFVILDASERIGDAWRNRWDSLRLFSPAWLDSLDGMPFPGDPGGFPTKDEMADYLEAYAAHFALPVRTSTRVDRVARSGSGFVVQAGEARFEAAQVIVAMASFQKERLPAFARGLRGDVVQMHSSDYKNPGQLRAGRVAIVGGGNSGAEIARELCRTHEVVLAGNEVGEIPFRSGTWLGRMVFLRVLMRVIFHRLLTIRTPMGRKARVNTMHKATPLIRVKKADLKRAGVRRVGRIADVRDGRPVTEQGEVLDVDSVIWCTGYSGHLSWIDLPIWDEAGEPVHDAGVVTGEPGLYFVGLHFLYAMSSAMIHGVGRDAARIAGACAARATSPESLSPGRDPSARPARAPRPSPRPGTASPPLPAHR
jgi:putative flavoprotein involved in K+ transport